MAMLRVCGHPGCGTFTLGELCIEHEQSPAQRADRGRVRTVAAAVAGGTHVHKPLPGAEGRRSGL